MKGFVVQVQTADSGDPKTYARYVCALAGQPYPNSEPIRSLTMDVTEAFVFSDRTAAELVACWVGGEVVAETSIATGQSSETDRLREERDQLIEERDRLLAAYQRVDAIGSGPGFRMGNDSLVKLGEVRAALRGSNVVEEWR